MICSQPLQSDGDVVFVVAVGKGEGGKMVFASTSALLSAL
jgi:hypothetical protein